MRDAQSLARSAFFHGHKNYACSCAASPWHGHQPNRAGCHQLILDHQPARGLETIHHALDSGADPRSLARQIVEYLRGLMLIQMGNAEQVEATREVKTQMEAHAKAFSTSDVLRMMKIFNNAATDYAAAGSPL
jgi:DNA polymerase III gamma/tau subunit